MPRAYIAMIKFILQCLYFSVDIIIETFELNTAFSCIPETVQLPRKLVRGQDVWLGKGAEQTRQILKCMWCGQSFRSLAEMTAHMQQTQHYTNIISQEQLISWRSAEDSKSPSSNSHVSAVLTCKVCDQAFSSLKELSNHMVKNSHYKEHIMRSITESGSRRRQSREKRKKSLPVRKLLELERANSEMSKKEIKITCEKCNEKIPAPVFVDHLRVCDTGSSRRNSMSGQPMVVSSRSTGSIDSCSNATSEENRSPPPAVQDLSSKDSNSNTNSSGKGSSESSSVINAIEKMIEKSFDYRNRGAGGTPSNNSTSGGPTGNSPNCTSPGLGATSILKRLGIDESVDYTKPLILDAPMGTPLGGGGPPSSGSQVIPKYSSQRPRSTSSSDKSEETSTTKPQSGCSPALSPARSTVSSNSLSPPPNSNNSSSQAKEDGSKSSLSALSSMFESIGGSGSGNHSDHSGKGGSANNSGISQQGHHPLAALQKLCDIKADVTTNANSSRPTSTNSNHSNHSYRDGHFNTTSPDRIMTPSRATSSTPPCWPTTADVPSKSPSSTASSTNAERGGGGDRAGDQIFKCSYCDTPFLSKGAYRHHMAKMHFIKEKSPSTIPSSLVSSSTPEIANNNSTSTTNNSDSPTSKFIKYTELAKQLSSK
ncbi:Protein tiptop [Orchesella cincta]|uniref:Protein tiptop n=1 Tax=Orchesella cincta TaxID=48709 RepID=A0A1D2NAB3_ORCCI|nr:Protein tiptop [Orchesella cincta]